MAAKNVHL